MTRIARYVRASPMWARWSAVLVASTLAIGSVNFAFGLLVARIGGEATWSAASPLLAAGTAGSFAGLGIEYAVTRSIMRGESQRAVLRRLVPLSVLLLALLGASVVVAAPVANFLHLGETAAVPLCVGIFDASVLMAVPSGFLVGAKRIGLLAVIGVSSALLRIALLWVVPGQLVERSLLATVISLIVGSLAMLLVPHRGGTEVSKEADGFGSIAFSGSLARIALWVTIVAPVVVARHFLPLRAAGELATVTFIASSIMYTAAPVATAFFPVMLADKNRRHVRNGLLVSLGLVLLGTAVVVPVGPAMLRLLYHTKQPDLRWLLLFGCLGVLFQTASGFLVWAALARNNATRVVYVGAFGALPLVGLLFVFHSSPAAVLVAALPSTAAIGVVSQLGRRRPRQPVKNADSLTAPELYVVPPHGVSLSDCSVGVMAHNEELTIVRVLQSLLAAQDTGGRGIHEVVVVTSGTDRTESLARHVAEDDSRVVIIHQREKPGKAAAVNLFLDAAAKNYLVLSSADVVLGDGMLSELVAPLASPGVGMCGGTVIPTNPSDGLCNKLVYLTWELHSTLALIRPKLGEIVAFRRCFPRIDENIIVDEVSIEECVTNAGYELRYVPNVVVRNHGPTQLSDFIRHRYRNHRGHLAVRSHSGYKTATLCVSLIARSAIRFAKEQPGSVPLLCVAGALEVVVRGVARMAHALRGAPQSGQFSRIDSAKVALGAVQESEVAM